jgi:hypothetical protein
MPIVKTVSVRLSTSGAEDTKLKIDRVAARADELGKMDPTIKVQVDTAAASVKLALLRAELRRTAMGDLGGGKGGGKFTFGQGASGFFGAIQKGLASILNMGPVAVPILAAIGGAIVVIVGYLGSLVSELAAAGIGLAAFGALAIPTFTKILAGVQAVSGAADATARSQAWAAIPKALQPSVKAGLDLKSTFDKLVGAMQPQVVRIFGEALKGIKNILPTVLPLARSVGNAIEGLLKGFGQFSKSPGFKAFMAQMQQLAGPAVTAIGQGLGQVAVALGQFLQSATSPQGIVILRGAFKLLVWSIEAVSWTMRTSQKVLFGFMSAVASVAGGIIGIAKRIADAFLTTVSTIAGIAAKIPGPWQGAMSKLAASADRAKGNVDASLAGIQGGLSRFKATVANMQPIFKLQGNIIDLQNKLSEANRELNNPNLTKTRRARIEANIDQLTRAIAQARARLDALNGKTVQTYITTYLQTVGQSGGPGGGHPLGAASGGPRSGWTLVGEMGPEIVNLPRGSYVNTAAATRQMVAAGDTTINIYMPPASDGADVVRSLQAYAKRNGPIRLKVRS